jgi:hypothetical protein
MRTHQEHDRASTATLIIQICDSRGQCFHAALDMQNDMQ